MTGKQPESLDEIDWKITQLLSEDPRRPYSDISEELRTSGYELSSEGVRNRVGKILDTMSIFFMVNPIEQDWEVMVFLIGVDGGGDSKQSVYERLLDDEFWFVSRGFGTYDLYAVATVATTRDIDDLLTRVRSYDHVNEVSYLIETDRSVENSNYFPMRDGD